jgi:hypothetical protein
MLTPFFYTGPNTARVNVAMDIPTDSLQIEKVKGKQHLTINVLGMAYGSSGAVAARFSDAVEKDFADKKEVEAFQEHPYHYENQFDIGSGSYKLTVVFSAGGESFGKIEQQFAVDPWDAKGLFISSIALSKSAHRVSEADTELDSALMEGRAPLVAQGMQITPTGTNRFKKSETGFVYLEVYEPELAALPPTPAAPPADAAKPADGAKQDGAKPDDAKADAAKPDAAKPDAAKPAGPPMPHVGLQMRVLDRKTNEQKIDSGMFEVTQFGKAGNPVMAVALKLPVSELAPGSYRAEFKVTDNTGRAVTRPVMFDVEE